MIYNKNQSSIPFSFREEEFWILPSLLLCSNLWLPESQNQSWPQEHHMNKLGRGPQGDAAYQISKLYAFQFQRRILKIGFFCSYVPNCDPWSWASFDLRGIIWTNLVEVHKEILYTKYQSSRPFSFKEEEFWNFLFLFLCSNLWPRGIIWTNLVEVYLKMLHTKYQSSSPYGLGQKIFKNFLVYLYVKSKTRQHRTNFHSRAIIWRILVEGH